MPLPRQQGVRRPQRGGLPGTGRTLHHHQLAVTGQGADHGGLGGSTLTNTSPVQPDPPGGLLGATREAVHEVCLHVHDLLAVSDRTCWDTSGEVSSRTQCAAAWAVTSSACLIRAAGSATRQLWASRTSTLPRMSAVFHADRFAPSWEMTQSAAPSRSN
jgi:hypothetical protein